MQQAFNRRLARPDHFEIIVTRAVHGLRRRIPAIPEGSDDEMNLSCVSIFPDEK
jgi:hypothetical protein